MLSLCDMICDAGSLRSSIPRSILFTSILGSWGCHGQESRGDLDTSGNRPLVSHQLDTSGLCLDEETWPPQIPPNCFQGCALDEDGAWGFQPACDLIQLIPSDAVGDSFHETTIPRCDELGADHPANHGGICYSELVGEQRSLPCSDAGWDLEFTITRDPNSPVTCGTLIVATCVGTEPGPDGCGGGLL